MSFAESPPPTLTRRATIGACEPVYDTHQANLRQRRRTTSSIVACERCRRRKIRCSGQQPCATCAKFGVRCTKAEMNRDWNGSAENAALADRVRLLEARLAAVSGEQTDAFDCSADRPSLRLETDFTMPDGDGFGNSFDFNDFQSPDLLTGDSMSLSVPTIQITGPYDGSVPSSPIAFLPSSSWFSGISRSPTPDGITGSSNAESMLLPQPTRQIRTPPPSQWVDGYDRSAMLRTPEAPYGGGGWLSRRSSISSLGGLDQGLVSLALENKQPSPQTDWEMQEHGFADTGTSYPLPSKPQAEALAELAFESYALPLEKTAFRICLEAVYGDGGAHTGNGFANADLMLSLTLYSLRMARCLVYLVLLLGIKASGSGENLLLEVCYALAHEQMRSADIWTEHGAQQIIRLLAIFGSSSSV